ncbi:MAG: hypothetical protein ACJAYH_001434 [Celeribacter sp.]|jgi:hypothetical protein
MDLNVLDVVYACNTTDEGVAVFDAIASSLKGAQPVKVDFAGVTNVTSSFVNSSFVLLIETFGYEKFKQYVSVSGANRQVAHLIMDRVTKSACVDIAA